jgi:hypothetical protein
VTEADGLRNQAIIQVCAVRSPVGWGFERNREGTTVIERGLRAHLMEGCQGQFEPEIALADSSRFQMESAGAPKARIPSVACSEIADTRDPVVAWLVMLIFSGPVVLPVTMVL